MQQFIKQCKQKVKQIRPVSDIQIKERNRYLRRARNIAGYKLNPRREIEMEVD